MTTDNLSSRAASAHILGERVKWHLSHTRNAVKVRAGVGMT